MSPNAHTENIEEATFPQDFSEFPVPPVTRELDMTEVASMAPPGEVEEDHPSVKARIVAALA